MDRNDLPERKLRGDALGAAPEVLSRLRAVDPSQADLDRGAVPEHRDRVAVGNADDLAREIVRGREGIKCRDE
jgi:hypothetical protein